MRERISKTIDETLAMLGLKLVPVVGCVLAAALVVPVFTQLTYYAALNADSRAVVGARDDDASNAIDIAGHSHWYSSNGFYPYGPVYFRIAHVIGEALSPLAQPGDLPLSEARSKATHLGLMMTSILAFFGLAFLLAGAWTKTPWARLGLSVWITWALLQSETWGTFLLRAHPDHLLALGVAWATWATARAWREDQPEARRLAAWAWGLALSVKMTLLMWLPFLIVSMVWPWRRTRVREALHFAGNALAVFFLVGFPQNFNLYKILRFLRQQSYLSMPATEDSVREWVTNWTTQMAWPLGILLIGGLLVFALNGRAWERRFGWRACALAFGPLAVLMLQKVLAPHEHYPMPVVATQLALVASGLGVRPLRNERALLGLLFASVLAFSFIPVVPPSLGAVYTGLQTCRPEARALAARVHALLGRGALVYNDPYVPIMSHLPGTKSTWTMTPAYLKDNKFDALILSWHFAGRYVVDAPDEYTMRDNPEWKQAVEVYRQFHGRDAVDVPGAGHYRRTSTDACGWEIWERSDR